METRGRKTCVGLVLLQPALHFQAFCQEPGLHSLLVGDVLVRHPDLAGLDSPAELFAIDAPEAVASAPSQEPWLGAVERACVPLLTAMGRLCAASLLAVLPLIRADVQQDAGCPAGDEACKWRLQASRAKQMASSRPTLASSGDGDQHADAVALLFSLLGGFFMGAYPVPIKAPRVLKASPHPVIFQCYKTFWVFVTGWLFLLPRWWQQESPVFCPTWWGVVSAMGWIPSGVCAIAAIPRIGIGMLAAVAASCGSISTFLVFWLVLGESMKEHNIGGHTIYFAPAYLACIILGIGGMVWATGLGSSAAAPEEPERRSKATVGYLLAAAVGIFSAIQFGAVNLGKQSAQRSAGCFEDPSKCPPNFVEAFNNFGSWMASFGIGALLVTAVFVLAIAVNAVVSRKALPSPHWKALAGPGTMAGLLWALGNFFQTAAVVRGGSAVMLPANQAIQLVTSGAFGLLYYHEVPTARRAVFWTAAALWTLGCIILLSKEKS
ncbi:unnamed protein product [Symbiodinium necroappetens]|uniref:Uncharacterized protein n=1 Tax=Symbiodinium necroappetens TaxID=1628268 RepID=A0A812WZ83_9DINO|nr:unnamed protein product [Symbiodinium necroappetens]